MNTDANRLQQNLPHSPRSILLTLLISCSCALVGLSAHGDLDAASAAGLLLNTTQGAIVGKITEGQARAWLGVPYASVSGRWRPPRPPQHRGGTLDATAPGPACAQPATAPEAQGWLAGQEDCLTLNVYAPQKPPAAAMPVLVWIHGGANYAGSNARYDGSILANRHNLVVVTINYRLGPFGWFHHPAVTQSSANPSTTGQFALLDMIAALEWVADNIANFGGDSGNVTLFGESAGGQNVYALVLSDASRGLFHKAIAQSGGFWNMSLEQAINYRDDKIPGSPASAKEIVDALLVRTGIASDLAHAREVQAGWPLERLREWLVSLDTATLLAPYLAQKNLGYDLPSVVHDGILLPRHQTHLELFETGRYNPVPLLVGANRDEQTLFQFADPAFVEQAGGRSVIIDPPRYEAYKTHYSDWWNYSAVDSLASAATTPVFAYRFDWDDGPGNLRQLIGASHGLEIPFVFGTFDGGPWGPMFTANNRQSREALSQTMMSYWAAFAYRGAPGRGMQNSLASWPTWREGAGKMRFSANGARMSPSIPSSSTQILQALFADDSLNRSDQCAIYRNLTMYPSYDLAGLRRHGCSTE